MSDSLQHRGASSVRTSKANGNSRTVTSRDVAKAAGVSQSLVSLILSDKPGKKIRPETRAQVLAVAAKLGYRPNAQARAMKQRSARTIGLLSTWETGSFVFPPVVNGLKEICDREGLALTLCTGHINAQGLSDFVAYHLENRIDGLVYLSHVGVTRTGVIETLLANRIPFACAIGAKNIPDVTSVDVDFKENGRVAAVHLLASGCRHPLLCIRAEINYAEREREAGFMEVFQAAGMPVRRMTPEGCAGEASGLVDRLRAQLREYPEIDGFCGVTHLAWQMLLAAAAEGLSVPVRLRVVSMDNDFYAPYLTPSLSTVDEPLEDIGRTAGEMLLRIMAGSPLGEKAALTPRVTARASTVSQIAGQKSHALC